MSFRAISYKYLVRVSRRNATKEQIMEWIERNLSNDIRYEADQTDHLICFCNSDDRMAFELSFNITPLQWWSH
jgi:hypothetical protein